MAFTLLNIQTKLPLVALVLKGIAIKQARNNNQATDKQDLIQVVTQEN